MTRITTLDTSWIGAFTLAAATVGANAAIAMPSDGPVVDDLLQGQGGADALFGGAP